MLLRVVYHAVRRGTSGQHVNFLYIYSSSRRKIVVSSGLSV